MKHKFILFAIVIIIFSSFIVFQFYFFKAEIRKNTRELSGNLTAENAKLAIELKIIRQQLSLLELRLQTIETTTANMKQETGNQSEKANNPMVQLAPRQPEKPETGQNTPLPVTVSQPQPEEPKPGPIPPKSAPARDDVQISTAYAAGLAAFEKGEYTRARLAYSQQLETEPPIREAQLYYLLPQTGSPFTPGRKPGWPSNS